MTARDFLINLAITMAVGDNGQPDWLSYTLVSLLTRLRDRYQPNDCLLTFVLPGDPRVADLEQTKKLTKFVICSGFDVVLPVTPLCYYYCHTKLKNNDVTTLFSGETNIITELIRLGATNPFPEEYASMLKALLADDDTQTVDFTLVPSPRMYTNVLVKK